VSRENGQLKTILSSDIAFTKEFVAIKAKNGANWLDHDAF
jgi:hypothetical protein